MPRDKILKIEAWEKVFNLRDKKKIIYLLEVESFQKWLFSLTKELS